MSEPMVQTLAGIVRGVWRDGSAAFLGIPFAQPPVGELRFAAPVAAQSWEGVRDAVEYGATAQRWTPDEPTLIPEPSVPGESTLNVNVFTPAPGDPDAALPVVAYIHGGGFVAGSPASPWYDGRAFNRDGIVTVTVSYRLGFDGFGWIDGAPQNRGVLDWLAALEWVQRNIAAFGGDPERVTIAGQSAGGGAVLTLLGMPAAQHLFHSAYAISAATADIPADRARATSARLAELLGVPSTLAGFASTSQKQTEKHQVPATRDPGKKRLAGARDALASGVPYGPVVDGVLVVRPTLDSIAAGIGADKRLVLGATDDEFSMITERYAAQLRFVPSSLALSLLGVPARIRRSYLHANRDLRGSAAVIGRYVTDRAFRSLVVRVANARGDAPTWVYRFSWRSGSRGIALHCLDVPFFFDCLDAAGVPEIAGSNPPQSLADEVHGGAVAFICGNSPGWTSWNDAPGSARVFDAPVPPRDPGVDAAAYATVAALI